MAALSALGLASLLAAFLIVCAHRWGAPDMVSDTYYQGAGRWFTVVMVAEAVGLAVILGIIGRLGVLNALGALGLMAVGLVPMYRHCHRCHAAHKAGAVVAAVGCLGWAVSVNPLPTVACALLFAAHCAASHARKPWYVAEILGFIAVLTTIGIIQ